jgi:DNA-binding CsgD family transcriptional regulator
MSLDEAGLLRLAVAAHEAAADSALWPDVLKRVAEASRSDIALRQRHDLAMHRSRLLATFGMSSRFTDAYNQHYSGLNIWRERGSHLYVAGRTVFDEQMCPRPLLKQTEFYNDYLVGNKGTRCLAGVISRRGDEVHMLTLLRDEPRDAFSNEEATTIEHLLPHFARAQMVQERLQVLESGEHVLNRLLLGVVMCAADGRVVFSNHAADTMLRAEDGLLLRGGRVRAENAVSDAALQRLFQDASMPGDSLDVAPDVLITRRSERQPYHVTAGSLRRVPAQFACSTAPTVVIFIVDPEQHRPVGLDALRQMYGLTLKEAMIAVTLTEGLPLKTIAEQLMMQYETARTHLRRILFKTGTSRQAELVRLLERISQQSIGPKEIG